MFVNWCPAKPTKWMMDAKALADWLKPYLPQSRGIFILTFKKQTQCTVGWHIWLLFLFKIKLLSMWNFKSPWVAAGSECFSWSSMPMFMWLWFYIVVHGCTCLHVPACKPLIGKTSIQLQWWPMATWSGLIGVYRSYTHCSSMVGPLLSEPPAR